MLLGVIADDFTGASDIAATIAKGLEGEGGLRTAQFLGIPTAPAAAGVEAGIVSLKSRSIPAAEAVAQSLAALDWLRAQGARQIVFKYCSTFDSTPAGNIGPVAEALAERLGSKGVVVCSAFPGAGRTIYLGHLFVNDRLLSESGMENHPLTPMTDPDIRRVLAAQSRGPVGHVAQPVVAAGSQAIAEALAAAAGRGEILVVVDAIGNDDLTTIGAAIADATLVTGGSGIARGLPHNFIARGEASGSGAGAPAVDGPEAILAGSCSRATRGQIAHHRERHPVEMISVDAVMDGSFDSEAVLRFVLDNAGKAPLVYSSADPEDIAAAQARYGREAVAEALDGIFGQLAKNLVERGLRRLVVAGGETSGAVVGALGLSALTVGREIDPGVPVLVSEEAPRLGLALKSGNFGAVDFFDKALAQIAGTA